MLLHLFRAEMQGSGITLSWVTNSSMELEAGDVRLTIILLKLTSNIPNHYTPCLWDGKVKGEDESDVFVAGCHNSKKTMLTISSSQVPHVTSLSLIDGITYNDDLEDIDFHSSEDASHGKRTKRQANSKICGSDESPPQELGFESAPINSKPLPSKVDLKTDIKYDNSLLKRFGNSHKETKEWLDKVIGKAKIMLRHQSLITKVHLKYGQINHIDETINASDESKKYLKEKYSRPLSQSLTSYFCDNNGLGLSGIAYIGGACSTTGEALNINEVFTRGNNLTNTARIFAHEIGHNIGMYHEHEEIPDRKKCKGNGLMSIGRTKVLRIKETWSDCSNRDFKKWFRVGGGYKEAPQPAGQTCMKESTGGGGLEEHCGDHNQGKQYLVTTTSGKTYILTC